MAEIRGRVSALYSLEQLAAGDTVIHRLHPGVKLAVTLIYIVCVVSLERHALGRLAPFLLYPVVVMAMADIPAEMILTRSAAALPFCVFAGISNLVLEREPWIVLGQEKLIITAGAISFAVLLLRTLLCVSAVLILTSVTPFQELTGQLRRMHVPGMLVMLFEMIYRYLGTLADEAATMVTAYRMRGNGKQWPDLRHFGPFVGQLLLRSADRAERVYHAMQCRGYGNAVPGKVRKDAASFPGNAGKTVAGPSPKEQKTDAVYSEDVGKSEAAFSEEIRKTGTVHCGKAQKTIAAFSEDDRRTGAGFFRKFLEDRETKNGILPNAVFLILAGGSAVLFRWADIPTFVGTLVLG